MKKKLEDMTEQERYTYCQKKAKINVYNRLGDKFKMVVEGKEICKLNMDK